MSLPTEISTDRGRPGRRVIAGEGMVTPRERLVLKENGKTEELIPGHVRFIRDHPLVVKHPELFKPADPKDAATYRHHRQLAERKLRRMEMETTTRTATPSRRKRFQLSEPRRERFRLP